MFRMETAAHDNQSQPLHAWHQGAAQVRDGELASRDEGVRETKISSR